MRLFVIDNLQNYAGIERILSCKMNYIPEQTPNNVFLTIYNQQSKDLSFQLNENTTYNPIHVPMPLRNKMTFLNWLTVYFQTPNQFKRHFSSLLNKIRPDIVICTVYSFQLINIIITVCHNQRIKTIMQSHTKGKTVLMALRFKYNHHLHKRFSRWNHHFMKNLRHCSCLVALTQQDTQFWQHYAQHIEVIHNMLTITPKMVLDYGSKRAISAGRYRSEKSLDRLQKAWNLIKKKFCDWELNIYDNGAKIPNQIIVDQLQLGRNVHLMPATQNITEKFSKISIYVMNSRYEGFGLVLAEAMSCGPSCVSFACPYNPSDIINDVFDSLLKTNDGINNQTNIIETLIYFEYFRRIIGTIVRYCPDTLIHQNTNLYQKILNSK